MASSGSSNSLRSVYIEAAIVFVRMVILVLIMSLVVACIYKIALITVPKRVAWRKNMLEDSIEFNVVMIPARFLLYIWDTCITHFVGFVIDIGLRVHNFAGIAFALIYYTLALVCFVVLPARWLLDALAVPFTFGRPVGGRQGVRVPLPAPRSKGD